MSAAAPLVHSALVKETSLKCHYHNIDRVIYSIANAPSHNRGLVTRSKFMLLSLSGLHPEPKSTGTRWTILEKGKDIRKTFPQSVSDRQQ